MANGHPYVLTPLAFLCEGNEDFIGRVATIFRRVSSRTCTLRTLQRYGVAFQAKLRRLQKNQEAQLLHSAKILDKDLWHHLCSFSWDCFGLEHVKGALLLFWGYVTEIRSALLFSPGKNLCY